MHSTLGHRTVHCTIKCLTKANREGWWKTKLCIQGHFLLCPFDYVLFFSTFWYSVVMRKMKNYLEKIYVCIYH